MELQTNLSECIINNMVCGCRDKNAKHLFIHMVDTVTVSNVSQLGLSRRELFLCKPCCEYLHWIGRVIKSGAVTGNGPKGTP